MSTLSHQQALDFLNSLINYEQTPARPGDKSSFNLERVELLLHYMGNPHLKFKAVHVAGTKGKGSTAAMVASILEIAGYKVGLYTSPHLICHRERIKINNQMIPEEEFAYYIHQIKTIIEKHFSPPGPLSPTFFEVYTAAAFAHFSSSHIDIAVVEVGLGGRLDATNVLRHPLVAIVTPISLDHVKQLGNDIASIAREKACIIKHKCHVVIASQQEAALRILEMKCQEQMASYRIIGQHVTYKVRAANPFSQTFDINGLSRKYENLTLSLPGKHQLSNATAAVAAVDFLNSSSLSVGLQAIQRGLTEIVWPARLQFIDKEPLIVVDCAHNNASAKCLAEYLLEFHNCLPIVLVLSMLGDKDVEGIAAELCPLAKDVVITRITSSRALSTDDIYGRIGMYCRKEPAREPDVTKALESATKRAGPKGLVCVAGSVYLAGEILARYKACSSEPLR